MAKPEDAMILIVDNDMYYSAHSVYFVVVGDDLGRDDAALRRLFRGPAPDALYDGAQPYIIARAKALDWWEGQKSTLGDVIGIDQFIGRALTRYSMRPIPENPRWREPTDTHGDLVEWIRPEGPRGDDALIRSIAESWQHTPERMVHFWEAFNEGAFR